MFSAHLTTLLVAIALLAGCAAGGSAPLDDTDLQGQPPSETPGSAALEPAPQRSILVLAAPAPKTPTTRVADPAQVRHVAGMSRKRISLDAREVELHNMLRLLAREGGINIIASEDVRGSVTLSVKNEPVDQIFLMILQSQGLGFEQRGSIVHVAPQAALAAP